MYQHVVKRIFDVFICLMGLPIFLLLYIVFGLLIKIDDRGPVFYKSERLGKNAVPFKMIKFRSMKLNSPTWFNKDGSTYNAANDPRVTKIGKFMRETSLDETPQIFNVLLGDMSVIGPRASLIEDKGTFQEDEKDKMKVKPGITGYCQAYYRNGTSVRVKRLKDAWYANHISFGLDVKIICQTIMTVFKQEGLYTNVEQTSNERLLESRDDHHG